MSLEGGLINAVAAIHTSQRACVFIDEVIEQNVLHDCHLQVRLHVGWPFFAALNGRTVIRPLLDAAQPYIAVYPTAGMEPQLGNIVHILRAWLSGTSHALTLKTTVDPPCIQVDFGCDLSPMQVQTDVVTALKEGGFTFVEILPPEVVMWTNHNVEKLVYTTTWNQPVGFKSLSPKTWDECLALRARVEDTLMAMDLANQLQKVQRVTFSIGLCPFSIWHFPHKLKEALEGAGGVISAAYMDFYAADLSIATCMPNRILESTPKLLQILGSATPTVVANPSLSQMRMISSELHRLGEFRKNGERFMHRAEGPIVAIALKGRKCTTHVEECVLLHKAHGLLACAVDVENSICYVSRTEELSDEATMQIFHDLGFEGTMTIADADSDHGEKFTALLVARQLEGLLDDNVATIHALDLLHQVAPVHRKRPRLLDDECYDLHAPPAPSVPNKSRRVVSQYELLMCAPLEVRMKANGAGLALELGVPTQTTLSIFTWNSNAALDMESNTTSPEKLDRECKSPDTKSSTSFGSNPEDDRVYAQILGAESLYMVMEVTRDDDVTDEGMPGNVVGVHSADSTFVFEHEWTLWFHRGDIDEKPVMTDTLHKVGSFGTPGGFWQLWAALDVHLLREGCSLHLCKKGTPPPWEDSMDHWMAEGMAVPSRFQLWSSLVLSTVGEMISSDTDRVCALVLTAGGQGGDRIRLWTDAGQGYHMDLLLPDPTQCLCSTPLNMELQRLLWPASPDKMEMFSPVVVPKSKPSPPEAPPVLKTASPSPDATLSFDMLIRDTAESDAAEVKEWLITNELGHHWDAMHGDGYDDMRSILALEETDLDDLGFTAADKTKLFRARGTYKLPDRKKLSINSHGRSMNGSRNARPIPVRSGSVPKGGLSPDALPFQPQNMSPHQHMGMSPPRAAQVFPFQNSPIAPSEHIIQKALNQYQQSSPPAAVLTDRWSSSPVQPPSQWPSSFGSPPNQRFTSKLNPEAPAFQPPALAEHMFEKPKVGWREMKNGREWRSVDWEGLLPEERQELWEKMEERTAVELTEASQEAIQRMFPVPEPSWQVLGKHVFIRTGSSLEPLPGGYREGQVLSLTVCGIGENPRLVALKVDRVVSECGTPHVVLYKSKCTRQEESNHIETWKALSAPLTLEGVVKTVWRMRQQKRSSGARPKNWEEPFEPFDRPPPFAAQNPPPFHFPDPPALNPWAPQPSQGPDRGAQWHPQQDAPPPRGSNWGPGGSDWHTQQGPWADNLPPGGATW
uniref:SAM domain-containing protein n=1 Tax=Eutreptiella gymnastica TaxID=73025 RepID=A0A7S1NJQ7_9EUGL